MLTTIACHDAPAQGVGGARGCALGSVTNLRELDLRYALFVSSYLSAYGCMQYFFLSQAAQRAADKSSRIGPQVCLLVGL
jgi:hypothetical protein